MYKLYGALGTGSACPQALLEMVGAQYEVTLLDTSKEEHKTPQYLAMNPRGQVPWLVTPSEHVLTESMAISLHIADAHPDANLIGPIASIERATTYRWMAFLATNIYESVLRSEYADRYTTDSDSSGVKDAADRDIARWWSMVDHAIEPGKTLCGEHVSVADVYMAMLVCWNADKDDLLKTHGNLAHAVETVLRNSAVRGVFAHNGLV